MMYWFGNGMSGWGYLLMTLNMLLFWGLVIAGIVALIRWTSGTRRSGAWPGAGPEQILAERYARGEIDEEEYHRRLDTLRRGGRPVAKP